MSQSLRIIVTGLIAQYPLGGVAWFHIQYLQGLAQLGHDVYYLEDSGQWPYNPTADGLVEDAAFNVTYLGDVMNRFGFRDKWAYRFPWQSQWYGQSDSERKALIKSADVLINVSGALERPQDYREIPRLVYIDTDPVFTQVKLARGQEDFRRLIGAHDMHFSYGERIAADASHHVPSTGIEWLPTRSPIVLSEWHPSSPYRDVYTTVMNWTSHNSVTYEGQTYGQKASEFKRFIDLPSLVKPAVLELAIGSGKNERTPYDLLAHKGWRLVDPAQVCPDIDSFRSYTETSKGEWSVAKGGYVLGQSGWFSERSARYLAAGRPVILQETGYSSVLPVGSGLLAFTTVEEAAEAVNEVESDYDRHAKAARDIAEEYFDAAKIMSDLLNHVYHEES
jgi:hypothetical protein